MPIFRDAAVAIERDLAEWDGVEVPTNAGEYHTLIREAMSLRLGAMRGGSTALELIANGQAVEATFVEAEAAMSQANARLATALEKGDKIKN